MLACNRWFPALREHQSLVVCFSVSLGGCRTGTALGPSAGRRTEEGTEPGTGLRSNGRRTFRAANDATGPPRTYAPLPLLGAVQRVPLGYSMDSPVPVERARVTQVTPEIPIAPVTVGVLFGFVGAGGRRHEGSVRFVRREADRRMHRARNRTQALVKGQGRSGRCKGRRDGQAGLDL